MGGILISKIRMCHTDIQSLGLNQISADAPRAWHVSCWDFIIYGTDSCLVTPQRCTQSVMRIMCTRLSIYGMMFLFVILLYLSVILLSYIPSVWCSHSISVNTMAPCIQPVSLLMYFIPPLSLTISAQGWPQGEAEYITWGVSPYRNAQMDCGSRIKQAHSDFSVTGGWAGASVSSPGMTLRQADKWLTTVASLSLPRVLPALHSLTFTRCHEAQRYITALSVAVFVTTKNRHSGSNET